ncbi:hypothetical protein LARI1_G009078 [Lachnellula arida]|uniref:MADS-box domain-containing protein n=1 Tax=Lachnellula arida TaxID=1316785 RepID=A0A8T9AZP7_9HELO|nr:hypothetical protein LARI1_G009078 [Lachnellula arida]
MSTKVANRRSERLRRRKETFFLKAMELGEFPGVDIAVVIFQNGRYSTFTSVEDESWPPSMENIQMKFPPTMKFSVQDIKKRQEARRAKKLKEEPKVRAKILKEEPKVII